MIRDPSDGSVREPAKSDVPETNSASAKPNSVSESGLRAPSPKLAARLQSSREWLAEQRAKGKIR